MFKTDSIRFFVAAVSMVGLASCSEDDHKVEARAAAARTFDVPPTVFSQGSHLDITSWPTDFSHRSSLSDIIELPSPAPAVIDVETICNDSHHVQSKTIKQFHHQESIAFFRMVPDEVLTQDLAVDPSDCSFLVRLSDDGLKKYGFRAFSRFDKDSGDLRPAGQKFKEGGRPRLSVKDLFGVDIARPGLSAVAELNCQDAVFNKVPFDGNLNLGQFPIGQPKYHKAGAPLLTDGEDQLCRVLVIDKAAQSPIAMTPLLKLRFNDSPLDVSMTEDLYLDAPNVLRAHGYYQLAIYEITNMSDEVQTIQFNQEWFGVKLKVTLKYDPEGYDEVTGPAWGRLFVSTPTGPRPLFAGERFSLKPREKRTFNFAYSPGGDLTCDHLRVRMMPTEPIYLQYLAPDGNLTSGKPLKMPSEVTKIQFDGAYKFPEMVNHFTAGVCNF